LGVSEWFAFSFWQCNIVTENDATKDVCDSLITCLPHLLNVVSESLFHRTDRDFSALEIAPDHAVRLLAIESSDAGV